ncbi:MAG: DUF1801 domain-containing protein [Deltaproteobacteria bacterium]|nr:DUF1801 domain-containing protein [Deltaproteobacteria bacterium]
MAENKTQPTAVAAEDFLAGVEDPAKREDCRALVRLMQDVTGEPPVMWGASIVGFGKYHYRYESGREGDFLLVGFSPRAKELSLYIMAGFERHAELMARLGKFRTGKACLYVKRLSDIDMGVLEELVRASVAHTRATHQG